MITMNPQANQPIAAPVQQAALPTLQTPAASPMPAVIQPQADTVAFSGKLPNAAQVKTSIKAIPALVKSAVGAVKAVASGVAKYASVVLDVIKKVAGFVVKQGASLVNTAKNLVAKVIHKAPKTPPTPPSLPPALIS
ncbi:MAG: hypothetical protein ACD_20C00380G0010 [uncultured bacterium]|nr:MAG: hypothetical protein ACD_20C00380G0010 [uncultured bacterium]HBH18700.1 hypothetical protein [Cyanobacteria bacterium UBA9579]